jgi:hypothetical protein
MADEIVPIRGVVTQENIVAYEIVSTGEVINEETPTLQEGPKRRKLNMYKYVAALSDHMGSRQVEMVIRKVKDAMERCVRVSDIVDEYKQELRDKIDLVADAASSLGVSQSELEELDTHRLVPKIFACTNEEKQRYVEATRDVEPSEMFTMSLSQIEKCDA